MSEEANFSDKSQKDQKSNQNEADSDPVLQILQEIKYLTISSQKTYPEKIDKIKNSVERLYNNKRLTQEKKQEFVNFINPNLKKIHQIFEKEIKQNLENISKQIFNFSNNLLNDKFDSDQRDNEEGKDTQGSSCEKSDIEIDSIDYTGVLKIDGKQKSSTNEENELTIRKIYLEDSESGNISLSNIRRCILDQQEKKLKIWTIDQNSMVQKFKLEKRTSTFHKYSQNVFEGLNNLGERKRFEYDPRFQRDWLNKKGLTLTDLIPLPNNYLIAIFGENGFYGFSEKQGFSGEDNLSETANNPKKIHTIHFYLVNNILKKEESLSFDNLFKKIAVIKSSDPNKFYFYNKNKEKFYFLQENDKDNKIYMKFFNLKSIFNKNENFDFKDFSVEKNLQSNLLQFSDSQRMDVKALIDGKDFSDSVVYGISVKKHWKENFVLSNVSFDTWEENKFVPKWKKIENEEDNREYLLKKEKEKQRDRNYKQNKDDKDDSDMSSSTNEFNKNIEIKK